MCRVCLLFAAPLSILVGYNSKSANVNGFTLGAITFDGVASTKLSIQDIKPYAPSGVELKDYMFILQTFNAGAGTSEMWWYLTEGDEDGEEADVAGWYAFGTSVTPATKVFEPGEGFMVENKFQEAASLKFKAIISK